MIPAGKARSGGLLGSGELQALLQVRTGRDEVAMIKDDTHHTQMGLY
jgi:hypothetical protein